MQISNLTKLTQNILVIITVIVMIMTGWLIGHILRHLTPVYEHPPYEEINPSIENGFERETDGIRRMVVLTGNSAVRLLPSEGMLYLEKIILDGCMGNTYYTSLPAKCQSADESLMRVEGTPMKRLIPPPDK